MEPKGYTTKEQIENYLLQEIDPSFDSQLDDWIRAVEQIIENTTGKVFIADEEASERFFDGTGLDELLIDDAIEVTKVEIANDAYGSSYSNVPASGAGRYYLGPNNTENAGRAVYRLTLTAGIFPEGRQTVKVTAKWGYSAEVPADVSFAATVFVAGILNASRQGGDQISSEKIGNYSVTYATEDGEDSYADFRKAQSILDAYKEVLI